MGFMSFIKNFNANDDLREYEEALYDDSTFTPNYSNLDRVLSQTSGKHEKQIYFILAIYKHNRSDAVSLAKKHGLNGSSYQKYWDNFLSLTGKTGQLAKELYPKI